MRVLGPLHDPVTGTKQTMLGCKLHTGTSKTNELLPVQPGCPFCLNSASCDRIVQRANNKRGNVKFPLLVFKRLLFQKSTGLFLFTVRQGEMALLFPRDRVLFSLILLLKKIPFSTVNNIVNQLNIIVNQVTSTLFGLP